jgi:ribosome-associated toxin RatA of RatAB toxin-antitoxin module
MEAVIIVGKVGSSVEIAAPVDKVFAFLSKLENQEKIFVDSEAKIEDVSTEQVGIGTNYRISAVIAGREVKPHWHEVVGFEENRKFVCGEVKGGPTKKEEMTFDFEATSKGTKVTMTIDYEFPYSVLGKLVDKFMARKGFEKWMQCGTQRAKEILEAT